MQILVATRRGAPTTARGRVRCAVAISSVEHCLVRKKAALGIFLDIVGAFDNVTFRSFVAALRDGHV